MENDRQPDRRDEARAAQFRQRREYRKKQEAAKRRRRTVIAVVLSLVLLTAALIRAIRSGLAQEPAAPVQASDEVQQAKTDSDQYTKLTIAAVGDITISNALLADARTGDGYDFAPSFLGAAELLGSADLTVGNLECNFAGEPYGDTSLSAPDALAQTLSGLGFDLLQTANSTSVLNGVAGMNATIGAISDAGMQAVGTFESPKARSDCGGVTMCEVSGIRVAFIAFTKGLGNMSLPANADYAVNLLYSDYDTNYSKLDTDAITSAMTEAQKLEPDLIIALVHWGSEYSSEVSDSQKRVARLLYENGASAIIGTHSHLAGPLEPQTVTLSDGTQREVLTAYDLGDFYTDSTKSGTQTGLVLQLEFTRNNWTNQITLTGHSYTPVYCADLGTAAPNRYQVLDIRNALALYDQGYIGRVPEEIQQELKSELEKLPDRLTMPEEEE